MFNAEIKNIKVKITFLITILFLCIIYFSLFNSQYKVEYVLGVRMPETTHNIEYSSFYSLGRFDYPKSIYMSFNIKEDEYFTLCQKLNLYRYNDIKYNSSSSPNEVYYLDNISRLTHPKEIDLSKPRYDIIAYENKINWMNCNSYNFSDKSFLGAYFNTKKKKGTVKPTNYNSYLNSYYCTEKEKAYFLLYIKKIFHY